LDINTFITILCDERYLQVNSGIIVITIFIVFVIYGNRAAQEMQDREYHVSAVSVFRSSLMAWIVGTSVSACP